jgi:capsular polysaccharide transport system permease protein
MATSYGRSPGGYLWAILEPLAGIAMLSIIFSAAFRAPPLGASFALFYASGFLPFSYYNDLAQKIAGSIQFSKQLLSYPSVTYFDAILARFLLSTLTNFLVFIFVVVGIIFGQGLKPIIEPFHILNALLMASCLGIGIGTLNCYLSSMFPLWQQAWSIVNKPLFILSGIIFMIDTVPHPFDKMLAYNPLVHVVGEMRRGFYPNYQGAYIDIVYVYVVALTTFAPGLLLLNRYNRTILNI